MTTTVDELGGRGFTAPGQPDSQKVFLQAQRHSRLVRVLRIAVPVGATVMLAAIVLISWLDPLRILEGKEELHAATASLPGLPERTRTVFILRRLEGQKYQDIAAHLGISVSAVEKHMVRAIQHLSLGLDKRHDS